MKIECKNSTREDHSLDVTLLVITLNNGETIEVSDEVQDRPSHLSEGITVWEGRMPRENAPLDELKALTRTLGIYPLAANTLHLFPLKKSGNAAITYMSASSRGRTSSHLKVRSWHKADVFC